MKILSYNIGGLNAFNKSGKLDKLFEDFPDVDVFCLQELKTNKADVLESLNKYDEKFYVGKTINFDKSGYAGVATFVRKPFDNIAFSAIVHPEDNKYLNGRINITEFPDFCLLNVYNVNSGNKDDERKFYDNYIKDLIKCLIKPYIIVGDMNVVHLDIDYWGKLGKHNELMPGTKPYERQNFTNLLNECKLVDSFRLLHPNEQQFSWFSQKFPSALEKGHGWRLDYALVDERLKDDIKASYIEQGYNGPDHSPVILEIF